jgi:hypothetical protein
MTRYLFVWQLRSCFRGAPSLRRGRVCLSYVPLVLLRYIAVERTPIYCKHITWPLSSEPIGVSVGSAEKHRLILLLTSRAAGVCDVTCGKAEVTWPRLNVAQSMRSQSCHLAMRRADPIRNYPVARVPRDLCGSEVPACSQYATILTFMYFHKEKFSSTTVGLSDHCSDQHTQGTRRVTNGQIPRPNTTWITTNAEGTSNIFPLCTRHSATNLIHQSHTI